MNLLPTEEQVQVRDAVAGVLERQLPFQRLFGGGPWGADAGPLLREAAESGWFRLGLPEAAGGVGFGVAEEMLLARELGRSLAPPSIIATALAAHAAAEAGEGALAEAFGNGRSRAGLAIPLAGGRRLLVDLADADYVLALDGGLSLARVASLETKPVACLDPSVQAAETSAFAAELTAPGRGLVLRARLLVAAQLIGLAERARDLGVEYAKTREQFGRPIGAFQAIKHRCSEMATRCEAAFAQACAAASALAEGIPAAQHVAAAYLTADEAAIENARAAIQIHGGIGVTDEHALHLIVKRRHLLAQLGLAGGLVEVLLGEVA